jgi:hypothetical protein
LLRRLHAVALVDAGVGRAGRHRHPWRIGGAADPERDVDARRADVGEGAADEIEVPLFDPDLHPRRRHRQGEEPVVDLERFDAGERHGPHAVGHLLTEELRTCFPQELCVPFQHERLP